MLPLRCTAKLNYGARTGLAPTAPGYWSDLLGGKQEFRTRGQAADRRRAGRAAPWGRLASFSRSVVHVHHGSERGKEILWAVGARERGFLLLRMLVLRAAGLDVLAALPEQHVAIHLLALRAAVLGGDVHHHEALVVFAPVVEEALKNLERRPLLRPLCEAHANRFRGPRPLAPIVHRRADDSRRAPHLIHHLP